MSTPGSKDGARTHAPFSGFPVRLVVVLGRVHLFTCSKDCHLNPINWSSSLRELVDLRGKMEFFFLRIVTIEYCERRLHLCRGN